MGRLLTAFAAALAFAPSAHASTLVVEPRNFSPETGALAVSASLRVPQALGVQLASARGRAIGWIKQPGHSQLVSLFWDGRINGVQVRDGYYLVRLVAAKRVVAAKSIRIDTVAPALEDISADNGSTPFAGDTSLLTTITPNGDGLRDRAELHFRLREPAFVQLDVTRTVTAPQPIFTHRRWFAAGRQTFSWTPPAGAGPRTYLAHLRVEDAAGNGLKYGADSAFVGRYLRAPVIRVMGIDAAFGEASYVAGELAPLRIATDAASLTLQFFHAGPEHVLTGADNVMNGVAVGPEVTLDWKGRQNGPAIARLGLGPWLSGLYYVQLTAPDGRVGYAPFVLRPASVGTHRVAVVLPTSTWQAYNFWDRTGDGWGDTWYAGAPHRTVELGRPYLRRGVIPFFRRYDLNFLHWLAWREKQVDYLADTDLESIATGDDLARVYDLVVFPGHTEYVQEHLYDVVSRYRDLGGNLAFLSANNFFWRVVQEGKILRRTRLWRDLGRPEGALIGVQYVANDEGQRQGLFVIRDPAAAPWLWDRTGLEAGGTLGDFVGGYGIEIDATGPWSPAGTRVLAEIPELLGPSLTAQMSYYETPAGAKVFAAGVLDFGGSATFWPVSRMLENLWARLSVP